MGKYFTIKELCKSDTAEKNGIDNTPSDEIIENLNALIDNVLDPLRTWYSNPIYVNSGYRCPELNTAVGGVSNSQHLKGEAADIDVYNKSNNQKIFEYIRDNLTYDQLLWENNGAWIHVSFRADGNNRMQCLSINS